MFNVNSTLVRRTFTSAFIMVVVLASACGGSTSDSEESRFDRPSETTDFIGDDQIDSLLEAGAVIHEGDDPPDIAGVYDVDDGTVAFDDNEDNIGLDACDSIWTVELTDQAHVFITSAELYGNCSGSSEGAASYVSGSGNCFSLYSISESTREDCELSSVEIISGCMVDGDIDQYSSSTLALERPGAECDALIAESKIPAEGDRTVVERGLVERQP